MTTESDEHAPSGVDSRTLALSDGIFAIALTLLVLSIHDPDPAKGQSVADAIWDRKGEVVTWLWSFAVVAGLWARHRLIFQKLTGMDARLQQLNLIYLGGIAFVPYPTNVLAKFHGSVAAVALYAGTLALVSVVTALLVAHATRAGYLTRGSISARRWWAAAGIQLLAIPLSILFGTAAFLIWLLLPWAIKPSG